MDQETLAANAKQHHNRRDGEPTTLFQHGEVPDMECKMACRRLSMIMVVVALVTAAVAQQQIVGRASVVDGDTIDIQGERIRFNGIDAPESWQRCQDIRGQEYRCGRAAADALAAFLAESRPTRCEFTDRDRYGRLIGDCYRADEQSVSRWLVSNGHALDWPKYSRGAFASEMRQAEQNGRGIWQGSFVEPWEARAARR